MPPGAVAAVVSCWSRVQQEKVITENERLYVEFASYYEEQRRRWKNSRHAPENPRQIFNLIKYIGDEFDGEFSLNELIGFAYQVLGFPRRKHDDRPNQRPPGRGLFEAFDPDVYHGQLTYEEHFVRMFNKRMRSRLTQALDGRTDNGRHGDHDTFKADPRLGIHRESGRSEREQQRIQDVRDAMDCLTDKERMVIDFRYRYDYSDSFAAELLRIDRRTVKTLHDGAIRKLRQELEKAA